MYQDRNYSLKYYWTFKEVIDGFHGSAVNPYDGTTFHTLFYSTFVNAPLWKDSSTANDYIEDLWKIVYARYYEQYTYGTDEDEIDGEQAFLLKMINVLVLTYPKYSTLLKYYAQKQNALLDKIETSSEGVARFNDTPQNEDNDDLEDDDHVTNLTKSNGTTSTDGVSPIERLKQIQDSFKSIMLDWSNEFSKLFTDGGNIVL